MSEYIGSSISLISKRDIRYVGTLHEINSENSTVALEQVKSYGTEGRSEEEVPPSDNVYEYIVFRGSDVKDLRIEKEPERQTQPPQVPDDPAILGNARPAPPQGPREVASPQLPYGQQPGRGPPPRYPQHSPYLYGGYPPPPNQRFGPYGGPQGFPPQGYPGPQYGPPPGWYPPPNQGFPHGPPGQGFPQHSQQGFPGQPPQPPAPISKSGTPDTLGISGSQQPDAVEKPAASVKLPAAGIAPANVPTPPTESKPDVAAALAPPAQSAAQVGKARPTPTTNKSGPIQPAIPIKSPVANKKVPVNGGPLSFAAAASTARSNLPVEEAPPARTQVPSKSLEEANRDARAAVAAAMANLPPVGAHTKKPTQETGAIDNLTKKVNEMRTHDSSRGARQNGSGGFERGRGGRGGYRGGRPRTESQTKKMEVPKTDYDFESANAKFNKQDLVKEAIASGDPIGSPINGSHDTLTNGSAESEVSKQPATTGYNKTSSFFDNISSELKDREQNSSQRLGGREFRNEERSKNLETFGQGSVDNSRGGYRGRYRGRGYRGRGGYSRGRGNIRGGRDAVIAES